VRWVWSTSAPFLTARALSEVCASAVTRDDFVDLILHQPEQSLRYLRALFERLRSMNTRAIASGHPAHWEDRTSAHSRSRCCPSPTRLPRRPRRRPAPAVLAPTGSAARRRQGVQPGPRTIWLLADETALRVFAQPLLHRNPRRRRVCARPRAATWGRWSTATHRRQPPDRLGAARTRGERSSRRIEALAVPLLRAVAPV